MTDEQFVRPSRLLWHAEGPRALGELAQFWAAFPLLALGRRGDGHAVLTVPGFVADDASLRPLRTLLSVLGYEPMPWALGRNLGPSRRVLDGMSARLAQAFHESGRPVSIVGQSLGGIYARGLARKHPEMVRGVITLGSPFRLDPSADNRDRTNTGDLYAATSVWHDRDALRRAALSAGAPLTVPATAIYTRTDGVVPWRSCLEPDGPFSESVEVIGSHAGLGHHVRAVSVMLDRLAQPEGGWQPYQRAGQAA
ncbi:MAG: alpha/beta hydrolase [Pseudonocardia sp.]|nr:alpha/beta hydrolase [Pseudonocardia sp.]